ncbi:MAG: hypothetical protein WB392_10740 [Methanotrichaceae archaeon]
MPCAQGLRPEPVSVEMSGPSVSVALAQGSINIWFGKNLDKSMIAKILLTISKIDSSTEHEREVICDFQKISEFESNGYILTSYARRDDKYRAIFVVPFSNARALDMFIESISEEIEQNETKITLYWNGGRARMGTAREELSRLGCFSMLNITYKEEQIGDRLT